MRKRPSSLALAALALLCLAWPALANHYPLLFPDTLGYLAAGRAVFHTLVHGGGSTCMRSALYALAILPFHLNRTPWPILLLHAAAVVYTTYLTTRAINPRNAFPRTLAILVVLGACTSLSWYISLLMPDILGAPTYLALFLLTFARSTLSRTEQRIVASIAILGATAHTTHLILAAFLCLLVWLAKVLHRSSTTVTPLPASLFIAAAALLLLAVNTRLYGHPTLDGNHPPYLEARLLADGPAASYLREHCPDPALHELCTRLHNLPANDDEFLWDDRGIWSTSTPAQQAELLREELPLAVRTLRTYPVAQLGVSARNFFAQLTSFGLDDFDNNDYMQSQLDTVLPHARAAYDRSLQAGNSTPWRIPTLLQNVVVVLSFLAIGLTWRTSSARLRALTAMVLGVLLANAFLTGIFSEVDARYQARIIWMLPLVALLALLDRREASLAG